jgi:translation elongation factor EF-1alpha
MKKFVAIGHVDTGKSCLCGHLLYKCKYIDERSMEKIKIKAEKDGMKKWVWSRVLDIYEEEMKRGKTHEFNTVEFKYNDKGYQLIDTPGHRKFVRSMIEGISDDVNIAVLLVSMLDNEFNSSFGRGMLKEHVLLSNAFGIEYFVIVANKMDLIDWDKDDCKIKVNKIINYLMKTLGITKDKIRVVLISAFYGIGLIDTNDMPEWYKGKSFIDTLDTIPETRRPNNIEKIVKSDTFIAEIKIFNTGNTLITAGYLFMLHCNGQEYEATIKKIKGVVFLKAGNSGVCKITIPIKKMIGVGTKIVLRKDDYTIGYGTICKVLN